MTLEASSHATLAGVRRGGVAVRAYDGRLHMVRRVGGVSSTVSWALPGQIQSHAMLAIVVEACKGRGRESIRTLKKPSKACHSNIMN